MNNTMWAVWMAMSDLRLWYITVPYKNRACTGQEYFRNRVVHYKGLLK